MGLILDNHSVTDISALRTALSTLKKGNGYSLEEDLEENSVSVNGLVALRQCTKIRKLNLIVKKCNKT